MALAHCTVASGRNSVIQYFLVEEYHIEAPRLYYIPTQLSVLAIGAIGVYYRKRCPIAFTNKNAYFANECQ